MGLSDFAWNKLVKIMMPLTPFKHQSVRDLAWAVCSPPLISSLSNHCAWPDARWFQQNYEKTLPWLHRVDLDPSALEALLGGQKDRRLGKYFETLWFYWLSHHPGYEIVENNVQIILDGQTLGEIDFIVYDKSAKKTVHWELAVKFYLGIGDTREMSCWHGPNLRDRLDIKVDHLLHRQSLISRDNRVLLWLKQQGITIDECAVVLKGRLYFPWAMKAKNGDITERLPPQCAPDLLYGYWFKDSEFDQKFDNEQYFLPLINSGWLERIPTVNGGEYVSKMALFERVSQNEVRLPLHLQLENSCRSWDRAFLVNADWSQTIS